MNSLRSCKSTADHDLKPLSMNTPTPADSRFPFKPDISKSTRSFHRHQHPKLPTSSKVKSKYFQELGLKYAGGASAIQWMFNKPNSSLNAQDEEDYWSDDDKSHSKQTNAPILNSNRFQSAIDVINSLQSSLRLKGPNEVSRQITSQLR